MSEKIKRREFIGLLGGLQRGLGALADRLTLVFGDGGQDVDGEPVGVRIVGGDELDVAVHQGCDEREIAGEAVELGDDELGLQGPPPQAAISERFRSAPRTCGRFRGILRLL